MKPHAGQHGTPRILMRSFPLSLSKRFFVVLAVGSGLLLPLYVYYSPALWIPLCADAFLILAALMDFFIPPSPGEIAVERPISFPLVVGKTNEITLEVSNRTGWSRQLLIRDDFPSGCEAEGHPIKDTVRPGSGTRLKYRLFPLERGNGEFGDVHFWILGRLGLVWKHGVATAGRSAKMYPGLSLIERRRMSLHRPAAHDWVRPIWRRGPGTEFDSLREYVIGDDARLLHWATTARKAKPIVRVNREERSQTVFIALDAGRMMTARVAGRTKLDYGLDAALLMAYSALGMGDRVGVMVVGQDVRAFLAPSGGHGQFGRILEATYAIEPRLEEPRFHLSLPVLSTRLRRRSLVLVFTDLIDERASEGPLRFIKGLVPRHLPLVLTMSDTEVIDLADSLPETQRDLYRQGVAAETLLRREKVLGRLAASGVMVLDSPPQRLSTSAVDKYLEIKTKGLL